MECGTSFGASGADQTDIQTGVNDVCPPLDKSAPVMAEIGDRVEAENGITVELADLFIPAAPELLENPITCLNYYFKEQKLNADPICFIDDVTTQIGNTICPNTFRDYGVAVKHWEAKDGVIPIIVEATTPPLKSLVDLFNACMEAGNETYGCLRYVPHTPLPHEEKMVAGAYQAFYSPEQETTGQYYASQWPVCSKDVETLLGAADDHPKGGTLRYVVEEMVLEEPSIAIIGTVVDENAMYLFAKDVYDKGLEHNMGQTLNAGLDMCYAQLICHEESHLVWSGRLFWHGLEEGAARYVELNTASHPSYKPLLDKVVNVSEELIFGFAQGDTTHHVTIKPLVMPPDFPLIVLQIDDNGSSYQISTKPNTTNLLTPAVPDDYQLVISDSGTSSDGKPTARFRIYNLYIQEAFKRSVICGEETYRVDIGLWLDGNFYPCPQVMAPFEDGDVPYYALDGSSDQLMLYNSGYCFFDGVKKAYAQNEGDFTTFFPKFTAALSVFEGMPLAQQYDLSFCTLEVFQELMDSDIGPGVFDVKKYAEKFGYNDDHPWCRHPPILSGYSDNFGKSMLEHVIM